MGWVPHGYPLIAHLVSAFAPPFVDRTSIRGVALTLTKGSFEVPPKRFAAGFTASTVLDPECDADLA